MKLGTVVCENKICNLDYMTTEEMEELLKTIENSKKEKTLASIEDIKNNELEHYIKLSAKINRAYTDKISTEIISNKVISTLNAIKTGIYEINPKFKEGSKNYDIVNNQMVDIMRRYESSLKLLSDFYDGKIELLILRKLELETDMLGMIFKDKYLEKKEVDNESKGKVRYLITGGIKKIIKKIRKKETEDVSKLKMANYTVQQIEEERKSNKLLKEKAKKEIKLTENEIKRINERKKQALLDAMEVGNKAITKTIKKPKVFSKITRFVIGRFNTPKLVIKNILEPLNVRIEEFSSNDLSNMKE